MLACGRALFWYTDGACNLPESPLTQYAAYAVVWDLCTDDHERCQQVGFFRSHDLQPQTFQVVAIARSRYEQDILRAELSAIVSIAINVGQGTVYVDCQTALDYAKLALRAEDPRAFAAKDHFDLLLELWNRRGSVSLVLEKVKGSSGRQVHSRPSHVLPCFGECCSTQGCR